MQQKEIFMDSEADAWFKRNRESLAHKDFELDDSVTQAIVEIEALVEAGRGTKKLRVLEVGCGEARRLSWLAEHRNIDVHGLEPSALAVEQACARGLPVKRGTADSLPFETASFDILVFGFCLYLCDRQDLFRIAQEADRVLKPDAWLMIQDFFSNSPVRREYHHQLGIYSYKMDYRALFDWHPAYTCYSHRLSHHGRVGFTDDSQEWVATSILRKKAQVDE